MVIGEIYVDCTLWWGMYIVVVGMILVWCRHLRTYPLYNEHRPIFQPTTTAPTDRIFNITSVKLF